MAIDLLTKMVLGENIHREVVFEDVDIAVTLHGRDEGSLDFGTRQVAVVEDAVFGVATLAV